MATGVQRPTGLPDFVRDHDIDHVTLDIIENTLSNARFEMDRVVETTAISPVIREQSDQFPLIADRHGRMVIGQFGSAIATILRNSPYEASDLRDGDVIALNDPYLCEGAISHCPDFLILRPIFYEDDLVGYASQWGNLMDVGGTAPGSMPISARSIYYEGIRMPPIKLYDQGRLNEEALRLFCHNTRTPKMVEADIKAIAAGTAAGAARVRDLCARFGKDTYLEACDAMLDRTRSGLIELIRTHLPDGERFEFTDYADDDGLGNGPIKLHMALWRDGDTMNVDWTGSSPAVPGSVNFYLNPEMFKMFMGVFLIMAFSPDLVFNDGYYDLITVTLPENSILRPAFPAPVGNRLSLMARQFDVVGAVFSKALAQFAVSGGYGTSPNFVFAGTDANGEDFQVLEILYGGIPARPVGDGLDGHSWWPMFKAVPTEYLEKYYPVEIESYRARTDSGGAGYHRGGHGVAKTYRFLADGTISFQDDRAVTFPWGYNGGQHGMSSEKLIIHADGTEERLPSKVETFPVKTGDRLVFSTAGAGGLGDPLDREPDRTAADVHAGLVSVAAAASEYGVIVSAAGEIDDDATERERERMRSEREDPPEFDFGPVPSMEQLGMQIAEERRSFDARLAGRSATS
ncbi:MAG: hydantoinase B/oxoprolinase family protein [Solirubrobacteraceae bacterium]